MVATLFGDIELHFDGTIEGWSPVLVDRDTFHTTQLATVFMVQNETVVLLYIQLEIATFVSLGVPTSSSPTLFMTTVPQELP